MALNLRQFGGVQLMRAAADGEQAWNFGLVDMPEERRKEFRLLRDVAPHLAGTWDGKTSISLFAAAKQVDKGSLGGIGKFLPAQNQPRGTCVGRGASGAANILQCVQIALLGSPQRFRPVSHAVVYGEARQLGGIRGNSDGAMGADAAKAFNKWGCVYQEEANDTSYLNDDVAVRWGAGRNGVWVPEEIMRLGADNLIVDIASVRLAQQAADLIANGYPLTVASMQGFTMTRDRQGFCSPKGEWAHQMHFGAVVNIDGRKGFGCAQSWGDNTPDGPTLPECPDYVFGVDWDVAGRMLAQGDSMALSNMQGWPAQPMPIDWMW